MLFSFFFFSLYLLNFNSLSYLSVQILFQDLGVSTCRSQWWMSWSQGHIHQSYQNIYAHMIPEKPAICQHWNCEIIWYILWLGSDANKLMIQTASRFKLKFRNMIHVEIYIATSCHALTANMIEELTWIPMVFGNAQNLNDKEIVNYPVCRIFPATIWGFEGCVLCKQADHMLA